MSAEAYTRCTVTASEVVCTVPIWSCSRAGPFLAFTMANLAGRAFAYACGSEAQAVALMDNLINGLVRERAQAAAL
jgi:hypothetical protein